MNPYKHQQFASRDTGIQRHTCRQDWCRASEGRRPSNGRPPRRLGSQRPTPQSPRWHEAPGSPRREGDRRRSVCGNQRRSMWATGTETAADGWIFL